MKYKYYMYVLKDLAKDLQEDDSQLVGDVEQLITELEVIK